MIRLVAEDNSYPFIEHGGVKAVPTWSLDLYIPPSLKQEDTLHTLKREMKNPAGHKPFIYSGALLA